MSGEREFPPLPLRSHAHVSSLGLGLGLGLETAGLVGLPGFGLDRLRFNADLHDSAMPDLIQV